MYRSAPSWIFHVLGCLVFLSLPILTGPYDAQHRFSWNDFLARDFLQFILLIGFFYLNYFLLVPKLYFPKNYLLYGLILLIAMYLIAWLPGLISIAPQAPNPMKPMHGPGFADAPLKKHFFFFRINHNLFLFLAVALLSLFLRINKRWKQTEQEKLKAELAYLRAQINPHFLFNTLNTIYSLAIQQHRDTPAAIQDLSSMMRYVLTESNKELVPLQQELAYISHYIDLQRLRFGNELQLQVKIDGDATHYQIAPLLLIPFIENSFKYGVNAEEDSAIYLQIHIRNGNLYLQLKNRKVTVKQIGDTLQSGVGLDNTRSRLEHLYPGKHELILQETDRDFVVNLTITLT
ncbi:MAG TPA: histidine kinase [Ferruginibacter sp.]|nr:histidine kinase [Ferruginibacter sp.]